MTGCPFCERIAAGEVERAWPLAVTFTPFNPITPGHLLIIPVVHVESAASDPQVTAVVMHYAAVLAAESGHPCNVITSVGADATQTVPHFHAHLVPRRPDDGLTLPWTGQKR